MRWGKGAILSIMVAASAAHAQAPGETGPVPSLTGLRQAPELRLHTQVDDHDMAAFLVADTIETDEDGRLVLTGSAEVRRLDAVVKGDRIDYQQADGQVRVRGSGLLMRDGSIVRGPAFDYNLDAQTGVMQQPRFWLAGVGGSGDADEAEILSHQRMRLKNVSYTGCPCPEPAWYIRSPRVDLHIDENEGVARHGVLYFKDVPLLYSPWLSFPLRKERKSGFLSPTYGMSSKSGMDLAVPYYFNLAPNYDATLTPRVMSKRGAQLGAEFRYLGSGFRGQLEGAWLPNDRQRRFDRWYVGAEHRHDLGNGLRAQLRLQRVSDDDYFRDMSSFGLNQATTDYLTSSAGLTWSANKYFSASLRATRYQTLQDSSASYRRPQFDRLPELVVRASRYNWGGFDVRSVNRAVKFRMPFYSGRHSVFDPERTARQTHDGTRLTSYTTVAYPVVRAGWYVTPKAGLHLSQYSTDWYASELVRFAGRPKTQSRALPILSVDSGMTFERDATLFGNAALQTLEPRLYYLYVPYRDQSELPIYDTSLATFNFAQAFDENIFSGGWDRIANANQLTLGLTSRWMDADTGFERLSLSAAQRIYFDDQRVVLRNESARTDTRSDFLVGASAALTDHFNVRFDAQFNPGSRRRNRMSAGFRWEPKRLTAISLSYRYDRDRRAILDSAYYPRPDDDRGREQLSFTAQWPLSNRWYGVGRYDYSLKEKRTTQSILGLEYKGDCCWVARVVVQRYAVSRRDVNTAMFLQLELSGLGALGTDPMGLLRERITGYEAIAPPLTEQSTFERYE